MKILKVGVVCLAITSLLGCTALKDFFTRPLQVICDNEEMAKNVKTEANKILDKALFIMGMLEDEWSLVSDPDVRILLAAAIAATQGVISGSFYLVYEVLCPTLEQLGIIQTQYTEMEAQATKAVLVARTVRMQSK